MGGGDGGTKASHRLIASSVGSLVSEFVTLPTDVAKTRMQVRPGYSGFFDCIRRTAAEEGARSLWKGLAPALVRQLCYTSTCMVIYPPIRDLMTPQSESPTFLQRLAAGGTAGGLAIAVFNPTEVMKTQMQSASTTITMRQVASRVVATRGFAGLWAGLPPNVARCFLVNAARLGTYVVLAAWGYGCVCVCVCVFVCARVRVCLVWWLF